MKHSFLSKLLTGILTILIITILLQSYFQKTIYPRFFKNQVINNIASEVALLPAQTNYQDSLDLLNDFSEKTQTSSTIIDYIDYQEGITSIPFITIENNRGVEFKIYVPKIPQQLPDTEVVIQGTFYRSRDGEFFIPLRLFANDKLLYGHRGRMQEDFEFPSELIDPTEEFQLSGILTGTHAIDVRDTDEVVLNQELLNITTGNATNIERLDTGLRYVSTDVDGNDLNLVYLTNIEVEGAEKILLTIYPLSNITYITSQMSRFNFILFGMASVFIILTFTVFSRRVSKPLVTINEATKKFANFEFSQIPEVDSDDEIGNLSRNINLLSSNLQSTLTDLQDKNQALSSSLELESVREQTRKDFVEGISHELKTPLAVIQATNEALSLGLIPKDESVEYYETIKKEISKSNKIIQDMMSVYKLDQADYMYNWQSVEFSKIIEESIESHMVLAQSKNIEFITNIESTKVTIDPDKITLVINNLISNAIKYAPTDSRVEINSVDGYFEIINDGEIPKESLNKVFEPFYRADKARARKDGSTGLGLYIARQILSQHQAEYGVNSEHYKVRFHFKLKADI